MNFVLQNARIVLIRVETAVVILSGWISQSGSGLVSAQYEWLERLGGLALAAIAMWRLMWYELPAWREELRREREANKSNADAILSLSEAIHALSERTDQALNEIARLKP